MPVATTSSDVTTMEECMSRFPLAKGFVRRGKRLAVSLANWMRRNKLPLVKIPTCFPANA